MFRLALIEAAGLFLTAGGVALGTLVVLSAVPAVLGLVALVLVLAGNELLR